jgi:hypothetical protein
MTEAEILAAAGRIRASRRARKQKTCLRCERAFETVGRGLYCSRTCRELAFRERHRPETPKKRGRPARTTRPEGGKE